MKVVVQANLSTDLAHLGTVQMISLYFSMCLFIVSSAMFGQKSSVVDCTGFFTKLILFCVIRSPTFVLKLPCE
jgi:hypothetical protein